MATNPFQDPKDSVTIHISSMSIVKLLAVFLLLAFVYLVWDIVVLLFVSLLFAAFGTLLASRLTDMQGFQLIINFLVMPLFFLSGALFPLEGLPKALDIVAKLDPLTYGIDAFRHLLIGVSHFGLTTDITVLSAVTLVFLIGGAWSFSKIEV